MRIAVVQFPGSNCDRDCLHSLRDDIGVGADLVWHKEESLAGFDAAVLPGGFSYGDYLRCGAIARFSPVMRAVRGLADAGGLVLGICNGFQILCESGLLPGALVRNRGLHFVCETVNLRVETSDSPFTCRGVPGAILRIPIAHGEGCYFADAGTLDQLELEQRVLVRYCDASGAPSPASNPNGSLGNIAGICNERRNVFGLMPHPERASNPLLGSEDGRVILDSMRAWFERR
jgi:phosphoribosylformylglycinamidine synthase subunit PurQ / glutaminase